MMAVACTPLSWLSDKTTRGPVPDSSGEPERTGLEHPLVRLPVQNVPT